MLIMKILIEATFLIIFFVDPVASSVSSYFITDSGKYVWSLVAMIVGNLSVYLAAGLLRTSDDDILSFLHCPALKWRSTMSEIRCRKTIRCATFLVLMCCVTTICYYFHLLFEQMVGPSMFGQWGLAFLITIVFDLVAFGIAPSLFVAAAIRFHWIENETIYNLEARLTNLRAFRTMRDFSIKAEDDD